MGFPAYGLCWLELLVRVCVNPYAYLVAKIGLQALNGL